MPDCRFLLDNLNDQSALSGALISGSDAADISGASMSAKDDHWEVRISTVNPAARNPRLPTSVALYLDADGRYENDATAGQRLGADEVYGIFSGKDGWNMTREMFEPGQNAFITRNTHASFSLEERAYVLEIPFAELPKDAKAYWRAGIGVEDGGRLTADYAPDGGYACSSPISAPNPWLDKAKGILDSQGFRAGSTYAIVIAALAVIFWINRKHKKKMQ